MAVRSVIDIEINDGEFKRFQALFARYQATLQNQPSVWRSVGQSAAAAVKNVGAGASATAGATATAASNAKATANALNAGATVLQGQARSLHNIIVLQNTSGNAASAQASAWQTMARNSRSFASNIVDATRSLLKWGTLTGVISGILGGGGLFGISRMAASVGGQRQKALGGGSPIGQQQAFESVYSRVLNDPKDFLGNINASMLDLDKRKSLWAMGFSEDELNKRSAADIGSEYLKRAKKIADETPASMTKQIMEARHITGLSETEFAGLRNVSNEDLDKYSKQFKDNSGALALDDKTTRAWSDLNVQLDLAGKRIYAVFVEGLSPLAGPIEHLSESFTKLVEAMLKSPLLEKWINDIASALESFATTVGTQEFREGATQFVNNVVLMAETLGAAIKKIVGWFGDATSPIDKAPNSDGSDRSFFNENGPLSDDNPRAPGSPAWRRERNRQKGIVEEETPADTGESWWSKLLHKSAYRPGEMGGFRPQGSGLFDRLEDEKALPSGILDSVWNAESGRGRHMLSKAGAEGHFQFMPATARQYGVSDPYDLRQSATGAAAYFSNLLDRFHGNLEKAVAGYNWGEGNVEKVASRYGDKWKEHLPEETSSYVKQVTAGLSQPRRGASVTININNATGANVTQSASQMAT